METIIKFLEQYWGYTLVGGLSLGTLVTFTVTQIKSNIKDKVKSRNLDTALSTITSLYERLEYEKKSKAVVEKELQANKEYFEKVQAATFQAISYLVIASKLPTEDKIALQEKFTSLLQNKTVEYTALIKDTVSTTVKTIVPDATETVKTAVEETKSLLDKYTQED